MQGSGLARAGSSLQGDHHWSRTRSREEPQLGFDFFATRAVNKKGQSIRGVTFEDSGVHPERDRV
jgi:hypothetical protein